MVRSLPMARCQHITARRMNRALAAAVGGIFGFKLAQIKNSVPRF
jgi:hypothetical protein